MNIRFEVSIGYQSRHLGPIKRTAVFAVANNAGSPSTAARSAPATSPSADHDLERGEGGPQPKPVTSFSYRSVGLNVDVRNAAVLAGNRMRATLNVEFSGVDRRRRPRRPPVRPHLLAVDFALLRERQPVLVAQSSDVVDNVERKQTVEVKATILR